MNISIALRRAIIGVAGLGVVFATTAFADQPPSTNESFSSCSSTLCIDAPPEGPKGLDGSGGWGWNNAANAPVTTLTVGKSATFTVTALQTNPCADGTITLTYSSQDFTYVSNGDTSAVCVNPIIPGSSPPSSFRGGVISCTYTDFAHNDKSDSFIFTPKHPTHTALITATVDTSCGPEQASETFPVAIVAPH